MSATKAVAGALPLRSDAEFLSRAGSRLAATLDVRSTCTTLLELAVPELAEWAVCITHGSELEVMEWRGPGPVAPLQSVAERLARSPGAHTARIILDPAAVLATAGDAPATGSLLEAPLTRRGTRLGTLLLARSVNAAPYRPTDVALVEALAQQAAVALESGLLFEETRQARALADSARRHVAFLSDSSRVLADSLELESTLRTVARLCVPTIADWSVVILLSDDTAPRRVAVETSVPQQAELAQRILDGFKVETAAPGGLAAVARTGQSSFLPELPPDFPTGASTDDAGRELMAAMRLVSLMVVPLLARGRTLGTLTLGMADSGRRFTSADLAFAEEVGRRAGVAVDNARLFAAAAEAVTLREQFLSIASHELKTPITALSLNVDSLERIGRSRPATLLERLPQRLRSMQVQMHRLAGLVDRLLDVSQIVAGRLPLERESFELAALIEEIVARFADEAEHSRALLEVELESRATGAWDRLRIDQVLTNLIGNALKYGEGHPVTITLRAVPDAAQVTIRDRGIGIAPADQARIFDRFERAVPAQRFGGFGLGLWIARQITESHGGTISVESTPGDGSAFHVTLPLAPLQAA